MLVFLRACARALRAACVLPGPRDPGDENSGTEGASVLHPALLAGGVSAAQAGEITGNGKPTQGPAHANSICTFSGLEDAI
jgi:hypothetical protein